MNILVTGANGYLGRGICRALLEEGHRVIAADLRSRGLPEGVIYAPGDLFTVANPYQYYRSPDVCLYLAGQDGFHHQSRSHIENLPKHWQCIQNLLEGGLPQLAVMGSVHEVGPWEGQVRPDTPMQPCHPYGIAKEALCRLTKSQSKAEDRIFQWLRAYYVVPVQGAERETFWEALAGFFLLEGDFPVPETVPVRAIAGFPTRQEETAKPVAGGAGAFARQEEDNDLPAPGPAEAPFREAKETPPGAGAARSTARIRCRVIPGPERGARIRGSAARAALWQEDWMAGSLSRAGRRPILRPTGGIFAAIDAAAARGEKTVNLCGEDRYADFVDYERFCEMAAAAITQREVTGIIDLAGGRPVRITDAARAYILAKRYPLEVKAGAYPDRPGEARCSYGDPEKIQRILAARKAKRSPAAAAPDDPVAVR